MGDNWKYILIVILIVAGYSFIRKKNGRGQVGSGRGHSDMLEPVVSKDVNGVVRELVLLELISLHNDRDTRDGKRYISYQIHDGGDHLELLGSTEDMSGYGNADLIKNFYFSQIQALYELPDDPVLAPGGNGSKALCSLTIANAASLDWLRVDPASEHKLLVV